MTRHAIALAAVGLVLALPATVAAGTVASTCTGDTRTCVAIVKKGKKFRFTITTVSRKGSYKIAVKPPKGEKSKRRFKLDKVDAGRRDVVSWNARFPDRGSGVYRVTWSGKSGRIATLDFVVR